MSLADDEVDLSLCFVGDLPDGRLPEACARWLRPEEIARAERFVFEKDRTLHLLARAMAREALSRISGTDPASWELVAGDHGRPEPAGPHPHGPLRFNLSHTEGLVVCAVSRRHDVGVDVESSQRAMPVAEIAGRFFSAGEAAEVAAAPEASRRERFLAIWTLKEAYLKARGFGLSLPLDALRAGMNADGSFRVALRRDVEPEPSAWWFLPLRIGVTHVGALAIRGGSGARMRARLTRVLPGVSEAPLGQVPLVAPPAAHAIEP